MKRKILSALLAVMMVFSLIQPMSVSAADTYTVTVTASSSSVSTGDTVTLTATVKKNGTEITDLSSAGLYLWWWTDSWTNTGGNTDATYSNYDNNSGHSLTADVTLPSEGTYYIAANLQNSSYNNLTDNVFTTITVTSSGSGDSGGSSSGTYEVSVTPSATTCEQNGTITFTATVTYGGSEIDLSTQTDVYLWLWADSWADGHSSGLTDCSVTPQTGLSNTFTVTFPSVGTYYMAYTLTDAYSDGNTLLSSTDAATITVTESTTAASEEITTGSISDCSFMRGMDLSTFYVNWTSGVKYYDYKNNEYSQSQNNAVDFFKFLYETCGVNWVRIRVWNAPYDEDGNPYGGGNNDLDTAVQIGQWASEAGMTCLIDFHYSDFWADPDKQILPKAWANMTLDEKSTALYNYTYSSLETLLKAGVNVGMVQVGNETNGSFCGEIVDWDTVGDYATSDVWSNICTLFKSGSSAVRKISEDYNTNIKVALHFTSPDAGNLTWYASLLNNAEVDYDAMGTSYYMYWHGTLSNLTTQMEAVASTYGKEVFIAETAYPYSGDNYDNLENQTTSFSNFTSCANLYAISEAGQEAALTAILDTAVNATGCTGMFYWEPAWIVLNTDAYRDAGGGWATVEGGAYQGDTLSSDQGSAFDNQTLFKSDGTPLNGLRFYADYVKGVSNLPEHDYTGVVTTAATCTEDGVMTYTCSVCDDSYTEVIAATGHDWGDPVYTWSKDYSTCTATFTCETDDSHTETVDCTVTSVEGEDGVTTYTATATLDNETYTDTQTVTADTHTYSTSFAWAEDYSTCTLTLTCTDEGCNETATVDCTVTSETTDATCTEDGQTVYTATVTYGGKTYTDTQAVVGTTATGHSYGEPTFSWSNDYTTCTAAFTCSICGDVQTVDCTVTSETTAATCTEDGEATYTATCTFNGTEYTTTATETISATGHSYGEPEFTWAWSYESGAFTISGCTATFTCSVCGEVETVTCTVTSETTSGVTTYTATATLDGKTYTATKTSADVPSVTLTTTLDGSSMVKMTATVDGVSSVTSHGFLYIVKTKLGAKTITVKTVGRTKLTVSEDTDKSGYTLTDGQVTYSYSVTPDDDSTIYAYRAFVTYQNANGKTVYVYSPQITCSIDSLSEAAQ